MTQSGRVAPVTPSVPRRRCIRRRSSGQRSLRDPQAPAATGRFWVSKVVAGPAAGRYGALLLALFSSPDTTFHPTMRNSIS